MNDAYQNFIERKSQLKGSSGFDPLWVPDFLFDFQKHLLGWAVQKGRAAIFADCGLGKTPMQLVWAENVVRKTNKPVLVLAPLAVAQQTVGEGGKFEIEAEQSRNGRFRGKIVVTNYEKLHHFNWQDFAGVVCDESSILKNFDGKRRKAITEFMREIPYRLLCTATPAPNDFMELGTSSEALGEMRRTQMLGMFFSNTGDTTQQWELKGHARKAYWRWISSWARAIRKPSDFDFDDGDFVLPPLNTKQHFVQGRKPSGREGFFRYAKTLNDQRKEKRDSLDERCEMAATLVPRDRSCVLWCHLNDEGNRLTSLIPDAVEVAGRHDDNVKEERLIAFSRGDIRVLVTKPRIASFGMNWQHCADMVCFPSHSHEQYYQLVRRCWRFGQTKEVNCHIVAANAEKPILHNMLRKERQSMQMFDGVIAAMRDYQVKIKREKSDMNVRVPAWL